MPENTTYTRHWTPASTEGPTGDTINALSNCRDTSFRQIETDVCAEEYTVHVAPGSKPQLPERERPATVNCMNNLQKCVIEGAHCRTAIRRAVIYQDAPTSWTSPASEVPNYHPQSRGSPAQYPSSQVARVARYHPGHGGATRHSQGRQSTAGPEPFAISQTRQISDRRRIESPTRSMQPLMSTTIPRGWVNVDEENRYHGTLPTSKVATMSYKN